MPNGARHTHVTQVLPSEAAVTRILASSARLYVPHGPDKGRSCRVGPEPVVVGADPECDLVLTDRTVSRRHAEVRRDGELLFVRDLDSTNGTFYGDARIREVFVPVGGEVSFGKTVVHVSPDEVPFTVEATGEVQASTDQRLGPLVGADPRMLEIFGLIREIAASEATVVIEGETGTGKELVAQAIHENSPRAPNPLVVFDCTNQPRDLIESSLFGHVKGAFTGATGARSGAFERAHRGTIFLDELGEFGLELQPKLLRVLESRQVQKVGGESYSKVDVRVITATNRNLRTEVRAGRFREDLYYRLAVVRIQLPPLRDRLDDVPRLVEHFVEASGADFTVDDRSWPKLMAHAWPGNVRELKNVVDRAAALSRGQRGVDLSRFMLLEEEPMGPAPTGSGEPPASSHLSFKEAKGQIISDFESRYI
ncbi:MAG: sigma 54-interacting transcriptional regulator, partial [Myxococcota bacterium]